MLSDFFPYDILTRLTNDILSLVNMIECQVLNGKEMGYAAGFENFSRCFANPKVLKVSLLSILLGDERVVVRLHLGVLHVIRKI